PLGEGKVVDGCVTCPWHGYQYKPHNGASPPPFTEMVSTYELRLSGEKVFVNPDPKPEGTSIDPVIIES
ncbi:MAG: sulfoxide reductase heme-binding subunit YedZ, partial [Nonlabens sp.]